jgi:hypothetical protein
MITMRKPPNRPDFESLKSHLVSLGATHVSTYGDLQKKEFRSLVKGWTSAAVGSST